MAGAGYKLFNSGDVLTAAQVNTYLMQQTVMVFANAAARTTALSGVVSEGMMSYLQDTNAVEVYDGSAWVASDDPNAIQNSIVDAKGDLITATADNTPARLASSGVNNQVLTVDTSTATGLKWSDGLPLTTKGDVYVYSTQNDRLAVGSNGQALLADSSATTGLRWSDDWNTGRNQIINGDFGIWQRGTSFTAGGYNADRWRMTLGAGNTVTVSRQAFTLGSAPAAPYESPFFLRYARTVSAATGFLSQRIEGVRTLAGQTVTVSFWAKAATGFTFAAGDMYAYQYFGSAGSTPVATNINTSTQAITTSWARYSFTFTVPSISGKTITTDDYLELTFQFTTTVGNVTFDLWGVQVEAGSVATAFTTASGSVAGELALCQRYYYRIANLAVNDEIALGQGLGTSTARFIVHFPTTMRTAPTALEQTGTAGNYQLVNPASAVACTSVPTFRNANRTSATFVGTATSGSTLGYPILFGAASTAAYLGWSAEL